MSVIKVLLMGICVNDKALFGSGNEGRLITELITLVSFTFGDTDCLGFMETVEFVFGISLLLKESLTLF